MYIERARRDLTMARVTRKSTRNTLKPKKPSKRQSRRKPLPKVAVHEETVGESETEESHEESNARVPKKEDHLEQHEVSAALLQLSSIFVSSP